jgi:hypothetical protein
MLREQADDLLKPGYLPLESGYQRLEDGSLVVANLTTMPGCKGYMVDWWFGYLQTDEHYRWWHPKDHVSIRWDENRKPGHHVGATHYVHEYIGGELRKLKIRSLDPSELLDTSRLEEASVSGVVYSRTGPLDAPVWAGHVVHLCRDTDDGCEMRSRFWLGDFDPPDLAPTRQKSIELIPDELGQHLLKHCIEEMRTLAAFLPDLYTRETRREQ